MKRFNVFACWTLCDKVVAARKVWLAVLVALAASAIAESCAAQAPVIVVAGQLVVDLRSADIVPGTTTWVNRDVIGDTMGNFTAKVGNLNLGTNISGGVDAHGNPITVPQSLHVDVTAGVPPGNGTDNAVISANMAPASITGNNTRSVEAWVWANTTPSGSTVVGWGQAGDDTMSSFRYNNLANGMFSGWFNDGGWTLGTTTTPVPINQWTYVAYTYDGSLVKGYINGVLAAQYQTIDKNGSGKQLDTTPNTMSIGAGRSGAVDPFDGYFADVRVHTGVLLPTQILNNYNAGINPIVGKICDFNGDGACNTADFTILRDHLFTNGTPAQGDLNRDGVINLSDYRLFKDDPNTVVGGSGALGAGVVPEPASIVYIGIAAVFAVAGRKRMTRPKCI